MKINELEDLLGVSKATVRYYEDQGLVTPLRMENGYRDYSDDDVRMFQKIIVLRKLGLGIPEIRDLMDGKTDLHFALTYNIERLRTRQEEIASAIELCESIDADASDFDSFDSARYLRHIYEDEQKGVSFAETEEISARQLNLSITLLGALCGVAVLQNKLFSEHADDPLPADIRANKKDGDEYATIGKVLKNGGRTKKILIAVLLFYVVLGICNGLCLWGGLGCSLKEVFDVNRASIANTGVMAYPAEELAKIAAIDPEAADAVKSSELFKFNTHNGVVLTLSGSRDGEWAELDSRKIDAEEGYLFVTGDPSTELELHVISGGKCTKYSAKMNDLTHKEIGSKRTTSMMYQMALYNEELPIIMIYRDDDSLAEEADESYMYGILDEDPPEGCYVVSARDACH